MVKKQQNNQEKIIWPECVIWCDEKAYRYQSTPHHAFYMLSKNYMNRKIVLDRTDKSNFFGVEKIFAFLSFFKIYFIKFLPIKPLFPVIKYLFAIVHYKEFFKYSGNLFSSTFVFTINQSLG